MTKPYTVVAILEANPGKETKLKEMLSEVIKPSREEDTCLNFQLHQDLNNPAIFILYENWKSKEAHQMQFEKPYIVALAQKLEGMLAKPYQFFCAEAVG
jgi:quinol monooxygenase YgiN